MPGPLTLATPVLRRVLGPIFRPLTRTLAAVIAIPAFRWFLKRVLRLEEIDEETEKDLVEWFKASVVLLLATRNFENIFVKWFDPTIQDVQLVADGSLNWVVTGGRLLLAIACVESMPDQRLFAIIHPGPPKLNYDRSQSWRHNVQRQWKPFALGLLCQHLNRTSPMLAIMAVIVQGTVGWICFAIAIAQYLIIGLVTSRDRAIDVLLTFDKKVEEARQQIIEDFHIRPQDTEAPVPGRIRSLQPRRSDPIDDYCI